MAQHESTVSRKIRVFEARLRCVWKRRTRPAGMAGLAPAIMAVVVVLALASPPALAQTQFDPTARSVDTELPMLLQADEMIYDNQNNQVVAKGNVEIYYGQYTLLADKVTYDRSANLLTAEGNVRINEPNGAVITSNRITLTDDFRDGFIQSLKIVTQEDARIAASRAVRQKGETTVFEQAVYTPCKPCEENPDKAPTWQIKAKKVIHKKTEATITYKNATFEMFGVPLLMMPYFQHADPTVKRKSGFLMPKIGMGGDLGATVEVPYYFALAPNYDFTFSPMYTQNQGVLYKGNWRHRLENGQYYINVAGIDQTDPDALKRPTDDFRGSIDSKGKFSLNEHWNWGWDVTAESDDTFRRFYDIDNILATDRISQVNLTGQRDRNYFDARLFHLGGLTFTDTPNSEAVVHPVIDYNYIFSDPVFGGELSFDTNVVSLSRDDGADSSRLISELQWRRQFIDRRGQVLTPFFSARGDLYHVSKFTDPVTGLTGDEGAVTRGLVTGGMEYRYPFVKHTASAAHIVEPIAQVIARPSVPNQFDVPNEDARSLVFDDTILFDIDKFSGYDRIESGTRANVGMRYTLQRYNGGYMRAVVGQSYQLAGSNDFLVDSGLEDDHSDLVTGLYIQPINYFTFIGQGRFDDESFELKRTDLTTAVNYGPAGVSVSYADMDAQPGIGIPTDRQEVVGSSKIRLTEFWSLFGSVRYDIERSQRIKDSLGLKYADDCFALALSLEESFIRDRDIEPETTVMLRFWYKHIGAFNVDAGTLGTTE